MTERQQLRRVCGSHRQLVRENGALRAELDQARREIAGLEAANAELQVEREAADTLMGEAMDAFLERR
jgi:hypothetical protein